MTSRSFPPLKAIGLSVVFVMLGLANGTARIQAGLTSSEVIVAVNGASFNSRTLANHFVALRNIPPINVIVLDQIPSSEVISVEDFRTKILRPILTEIDRRKLAGHVQCIAYSADFPSAIDISADLKSIENLNKVFTKTASINGLTYLYTRVNTADPSYIDLNSNYYARRKLESYFSNPGGQSTEQTWSEIQKSILEKNHKQAAENLEKLVAEHPHQFPLAYLAAAETALAGDGEKAVKLLEKAISSGWNAGGFLANDERFDGIRDNPNFQVLEFLVDPQIKEFQPIAGFDARIHWTPNGVPVKDGKFGFRYMLSTVLGITRGSGTTLPEAIAAIKRSASADFSHPEGSFYFSVTSDVRTTTRKWGFLSAVDSLEELGFDAKLIQTALPQNQSNVLGAQTGTANFNWAQSGSNFAPGALADNLTSLGGVMTAGSGQTKLTEFIKAGAAGSSGAVTEPYAIQEKFPLPQMYVHYASGASLAEAFYLNVQGPYQLLIVGDPLCRPFSNAPQQQLGRDLRKLRHNDVLELELDLSGEHFLDWIDDGKKQAGRTAPLAPAAVSVLFDGATPQSRLVQPKINIKLSGQPPGYHEITLRFAADDPLSQRHESTLPIWLGDEELVRVAVLDVTPQPPTPPLTMSAIHPISLRDASVRIKVESSEAARITLWHDWEQVAFADGSEAEFKVGLETIGLGPARIQARAERDDGTTIQSLPTWLEITP